MRPKENTRSKVSERGDQKVTSHTKRKLEHSPSRNSKVSTKVRIEQEEIGDLYMSSGAKDSHVPGFKEEYKAPHQHSHSFTNHRGDAALLEEDEAQMNLRKGGQSQSKLEKSWTRHREESRPEHQIFSIFFVKKDQGEQQQEQ